MESDQKYHWHSSIREIIYMHEITPQQMIQTLFSLTSGPKNFFRKKYTLNQLFSFGNYFLREQNKWVYSNVFIGKTITLKNEKLPP